VNDLDIVRIFSDTGVNPILCLLRAGNGRNRSTSHLRGMPAGNRCADTGSPNVREVRTIFGFHLLDLLEPLPAGKHVELSGDAQHQRLMRCLLGVVWNVNVSIDQPGEERAASPFDYLCVSDLQFRSADAADLTVLDQHTAMFQHLFAVKHANVTYELRNGCGLTPSRNGREEYREDEGCWVEAHADSPPADWTGIRPLRLSKWEVSDKKQAARGEALSGLVGEVLRGGG
jgi:hypothetical protein